MAAPREGDVLEVEVRIAARPETIFPFFTDPAKMVQWKGISADLEPRPGGIYRVNVTGHHISRGQYVEVVPFSRVVFTWGWEGEDSQLPPGSREPLNNSAQAWMGRVVPFFGDVQASL